MTPPELSHAYAFVDLSLIGEVGCNEYTLDRAPERLIETAKRLQIDPAEIRKKPPYPSQAARAAESGARRKGGKKTAPDATQAARAAEPDMPAQTHVETNKGRASAAGEALPPETAWPFPVLSRRVKPQEETNEKPSGAATE